MPNLRCSITRKMPSESKHRWRSYPLKSTELNYQQKTKELEGLLLTPCTEMLTLHSMSTASQIESFAALESELGTMEQIVNTSKDRTVVVCSTLFDSLYVENKLLMIENNAFYINRKSKNTGRQTRS